LKTMERESGRAAYTFNLSGGAQVEIVVIDGGGGGCIALGASAVRRLVM